MPELDGLEGKGQAGWQRAASAGVGRARADLKAIETQKA